MMDLHVQLSEVTVSTSNHVTVTSNSALKPQPLQCPVAGCDKHSMSHINICHNNYSQHFNSGAVDYNGAKSKSHPKDLHKEKSKDADADLTSPDKRHTIEARLETTGESEYVPTVEHGPTAESEPKRTVESESKLTTESQPGPTAESKPKPTAESEPKLSAKSEPITPVGSETRPTTDSESGANTQSNPKPNAESWPSAESEHLLTAESEPKSTAESEPKPTAKPEHKSTAELEPRPTAGSETRPTTESEIIPNTQSKPKPTAESKLWPSAETKPKPTVESEAGQTSESETGLAAEQKPKTTAELENGQTTESEISQSAESDPGLMTENETLAYPVPKSTTYPLFNDLICIFQHVRLRTLRSTILQLILFMVCFCGAYGKSKQNTPCQLMFVCQLYSDKLLLKCFYNGHCEGTLKWTGGKSGTKPLFNVKTSPTEKVRFIDGKGEKWFGMQIKDWNHEDIEAHYKCWFGFSKLIVDIVNRAVLDQPFDADLVLCKHTNGENNLILDAKVFHTNRQPSFTAFIQDQNITKHLTSIENPKKNGSWFETRIKLNLKLTKEDNNKTFMLLFRENIIIKEIINTTLCRGNEDSLKSPCGDKVCQMLLLCLGCSGGLAAAFFCIVYKKDLLCFKIETDTREGEREPMTTMNTNKDTDDSFQKNTDF
ncbi:uncharacterized protein LOC127705143 [Mytilus californianus]|uniref:uncharacterized protein LOC127705143 n=1 Tax=Mytilus californianus TaxID=6549 RepID=UPI0022478274|nr:uncharacterized protein LOC127705143 [Mytilus californianus]